MESPDPFSPQMQVREDARRNDIQRRILELQGERQEVEQASERDRRRHWNEIHEQHTLSRQHISGRDWRRLRDEYLLSLGVRAHPNTQTQDLVVQKTWVSRRRRLRRLWPWKCNRI